MQVKPGQLNRDEAARYSKLHVAVPADSASKPDWGLITLGCTASASNALQHITVGKPN